jgi:(p)ppGpp synthase/HD superfamily hydrolase
VKSPISPEPISLLDRAIMTACVAHAGQVDRGGQPYILHPLRVMIGMDDEPSRIVALLHDVVEDSKVITLVNIQYGFGEGIATAVSALTRLPGESYDNYLSRVEQNPLAVKVKIADLRDNMDMTRPAQATSADWERFDKYTEALARLTKL